MFSNFVYSIFNFSQQIVWCRQGNTGQKVENMGLFFAFSIFLLYAFRMHVTYLNATDYVPVTILNLIVIISEHQKTKGVFSLIIFLSHNFKKLFF